MSIPTYSIQYPLLSSSCVSVFWFLLPMILTSLCISWHTMCLRTKLLSLHEQLNCDIALEFHASLLSRIRMAGDDAKSPEAGSPHMSPCARQFYTLVTCRSNSFKNLSPSLFPFVNVLIIFSLACLIPGSLQ